MRLATTKNGCFFLVVVFALMATSTTTTNNMVVVDAMKVVPKNTAVKPKLKKKNSTPSTNKKTTTKAVAVKKPTTKAVESSSTFMSDFMQRMKVGFYFALWYSLNVYYNIVNKRTLNAFPAPMTVGSLQLLIGAIYVQFLWIFNLRGKPAFSNSDNSSSIMWSNGIRRVAMWHGLGQLCTMVSLGAGPVSFTHIVKALEPFFSAGVSAIVFGKWMSLGVYLTLFPVVGGVGYACLKEPSFTWLAFSTAMSSNLAFALRAVLSKQAMTSGPTSQEQPKSALPKNWSAPNVFGLVTCAAFFWTLPLALINEGPGLMDLWKSSPQSSKSLLTTMTLSGLFHYLNNEVMYLALSNVHPVTLAVGNTMKRVFIMVASVMVFRNKISTQSAAGAAVGISGVLLYSLTKQRYEKAQLLLLEQEATNKNKKKKNNPLKKFKK